MILMHNDVKKKLSDECHQNVERIKKYRYADHGILWAGNGIQDRVYSIRVPLSPSVHFVMALLVKEALEFL